MKKPKTTYRIICPNHGEKGHSTHAYTKKDEATAVESLSVMDMKMEVNALRVDGTYSYYKSEIGWRVQKQTVTPWEDV